MADLATQLRAEMNALLAGQTPGSASQDLLVGGALNASRFYAAIDTSCILTTHNGCVIGTDANYSWILFAHHYTANEVGGETVTVTRNDGVQESRTLLEYNQVMASPTQATDIGIGKVARFSDAVIPAKTLPADAMDYLDPLAPSPDDIPLVCFNQFKRAAVNDWSDFLDNVYFGSTATYGLISIASGTTYNAWNIRAILNDSSSPLGIILNGQFIIISEYTTAGSGWAPFSSLPQINAMIAQMGGTTTVGTVDVSSYTKVTHVARDMGGTTPPPVFFGDAMNFTVNPDGSGDYLTLDAFFAALDGGLLTSGPFVPFSTVTLAGGNGGQVLGHGTVDLWNIGTLTVTAAAGAKPTADNMSDAGVAYIHNGTTSNLTPLITGVGNGGTYAFCMIFDGIQIGSDTYRWGLSVKTAGDFKGVIAQNCRMKTGITLNSSGIGTSFGLKLSAGVDGSTIQADNNIVASSFAQVTGTVRGLWLDVAAGTGVNVYGRYNSIFTDNLKSSAIHLTTAAGTSATREVAFNEVLGSGTTVPGFTISDSGTVTNSANCGHNVSTDTTSSYFTSSFIMTAASRWTTPGTNFIPTSGMQPTIYTNTPLVPTDIRGVKRPQSGAVTTGAYQPGSNVSVGHAGGTHDWLGF